MEAIERNNAYNLLLSSFLDYARKESKSKKQIQNYDLEDAFKCSSLFDERNKTLNDAFLFLSSNPLRNNDYYKYLNAYITTGVKLSTKYFKHDLNLLNELYERHKDDKINRFNVNNFHDYVLFMFLKLKGNYKKEDDAIFNVTYKDNREYNPLSKIPSILRSCLPFDVMEFDIKRAFPTFIDLELNSEYRHTIYEKVSKKEFAMLLNCNVENNTTLEQARTGLSKVYGTQTSDVLTDERYNEKGRVFKDFTKYEKEYIEKFTKENELTNYARLHDGIFTLANTNCENLKFGIVEFSVKECIKPKILKNTKSFYSFNEKNQVVTNPSMYADFLIQEKFIRVSSPDDKILLLKDSNNVIEYFNHKTNMVSFLESEINEAGASKNIIRDTIARDNLNVLHQSYTLINPTKLIYYKDSKTSFGLPFKNGFFYFDKIIKMEIKRKEYSDVNGFFTPHKIQSHEFEYTDEVGDYETFIQRIVTGVKKFDFCNIEHTTLINSIMSIFGYYFHNHKSMTEAHTIIFTDEGANDETRNGRRGKTIIILGINQVTKTLIKGGDEFSGDYQFKFDDLDESVNVYVLDDVPANFNYHHLYTNTTGSINAHKKGKQAVTIDFYNSPKFAVTTNWLFRNNKNDDSTNERFKEFKIKPYYNINHKPSDEFEKRFFEDWDSKEWNKFYSFVFRCVNYYLLNGLEFIEYDKTDDNYRAEFTDDVRLSEMERIMSVLLNPQGDLKLMKDFNVSDFLSIYERFDNPLSKQKLFTTKNTKKLIDIYLEKNEIFNFSYCKTWRKWKYQADKSQNVA